MHVRTFQILFAVTMLASWPAHSSSAISDAGVGSTEWTFTTSEEDWGQTCVAEARQGEIAIGVLASEGGPTLTYVQGPKLAPTVASSWSVDGFASHSLKGQADDYFGWHSFYKPPLDLLAEMRWGEILRVQAGSLPQMSFSLVGAGEALRDFWNCNGASASEVHAGQLIKPGMRLYYGYLTGMTVTVSAVEGIDTSAATIKAAITRNDATAFCRDYVLSVTPECIDEQLAKVLEPAIRADCGKGTFSTFEGRRYEFRGATKPSGSNFASFDLRDLDLELGADVGEVNRFKASSQFDALCPSSVGAALARASGSTSIPALPNEAGDDNTIETAIGCGFKVGYSRWDPTDCVVQKEGGTISVRWQGAGDKVYLTRLAIDPDGAKAEAVWSGFAGGEYTTEPLGILGKDGNCWFNETARLCFTRQGEGEAYADDSAADDPDYDGEISPDFGGSGEGSEIAQEIAGDEEEAERARANEAARQGGAGAPFANASSFRGLQLGMTKEEVALSLPDSFTLSEKGMDFSVMVTPESIGDRGYNDKRLFVVRGDEACGVIFFAEQRVRRLRFYQCYFDMEGKIMLEDFARQVISNFGLDDGMTPHVETKMAFMTSVQQLEYVGVKSTTGERFAVASNELVIYLTVERVQKANFN